MTNGTTYFHRSCEHRGPNQVHVQEEYNLRHHWSRGSCPEHDHKVSNFHRDSNIIYANISLSDCMERGMSKRGITRREYQICILEARYPCKERTNFTKSAQSAKRKYQNGRCFETRSVCRNKQAADESDPADTIESNTKRLCIRDRQVVNVTLRDKVFQGVGSDLIAPWLTPVDLYNTKQAFPCDWDWGQTWHGGKVKDIAVAAQVVVEMLHGKNIEHSVRTFGLDNVFSALWFILPRHMFVPHAHRLKHWKSIKRLDRLRV